MERFFCGLPDAAVSHCAKSFASTKFFGSNLECIAIKSESLVKDLFLGETGILGIVPKKINGFFLQVNRLVWIELNRLAEYLGS